jgi:hypothetical protein
MIPRILEIEGAFDAVLKVTNIIKPTTAAR